MEKSGATLRGHAAEFAAHDQGASPFFLAHEVVETHLQHFGPVLKWRFDGVELGQRLADHAQCGITAGRPQSPFETHSLVLSKDLAKQAFAVSGAHKSHAIP